MGVRTVTGRIYHSGGNVAWSGATVTFRLIYYFATSEIAYPNEIKTVTTDASGDFSVNLATPTTGSAYYACKLPASTVENFTFYISTNATPITLQDLINGAGGVGVDVDTLDEILTALTLLDLSDTPNTYSGQALKVLRVKADETGIEFATGGGGGVTDHGDLTGLGDDDHTQYHNNTRGDARYWQLSTDLATQTELNTHEADTTNVHGITDTSAIVVTTDTRLLTNAEKTDLTDGGDSNAHFHSSDRNRSNHTGTQVAGTISDLAETVEDIIGTKVVAGSNVTVTYNDTTGITTVASSGGSGTALGRAKSVTDTVYSIPGVEITASTTVGVSANSIRYEPFIIETPITLDQLAIEVTTAGSASSVARLGIYNADTDWQPTTIVIDAGTVAVDTTGIKAISINQTLQPGRYLFAINTNSSGLTCRMVRGGSVFSGLNPSLGSNTLIASITVGSAFSSLPDPGTDWTAIATATTPLQRIVFCRIATP